MEQGYKCGCSGSSPSAVTALFLVPYIGLTVLSANLRDGN